MGNSLKPAVTIKGTKDGLLFYLDDSRPFSDILKELQYKLEDKHAAKIWEGPEMNVLIKLGKRQITKTEEIALCEMFSTRKNLVVKCFETDGKPHLLESDQGIQMRVGTVRSGQIFSFEGNILFAGDVNPGGVIQSTGDIYVLGALRGLAHAGSNGDQKAIIAASVLKPTQLRIADVISRPPDRWDESEVGMRFAYLVDNQIAVEKMVHLSKIRPEKEWKENM